MVNLSGHLQIVDVTAGSFPTSLTYNGNSVVNSFEMAELFNTYFKSVFSLDNSDDFPDCKHFINDCLSNVILTIDEVTDILNDLNPNKALGPDGIPTRVVRTCSEQLALPLTLIFNTSLQTGVFPSLFKRGNVVPIFKSESRNEASNYRPISLLPIFSKVFEKAVFPHIYNHVQNSLDINQHGFVKGRSQTIFPLLSIIGVKLILYILTSAKHSTQLITGSYFTNSHIMDLMVVFSIGFTHTYQTEFSV